MTAAALDLPAIACPLCGARRAVELCVALGVPGRFALALCEGCGLPYQNPRVRRDRLDRMRALVERCVGRIVDEWHSCVGGGMVKLVLEVALRAAGPARRGEVTRSSIGHGASCAS